MALQIEIMGLATNIQMQTQSVANTEAIADNGHHPNDRNFRYIIDQIDLRNNQTAPSSTSL